MVVGVGLATVVAAGLEKAVVGVQAMVVLAVQRSCKSSGK
jgi:hypothetical protein